MPTDGAPGLRKAVEAIWPCIPPDALLGSEDAKLATASTTPGVAGLPSPHCRHAGCPDLCGGHCRFARLVDAYQRRYPAACRCGADDVEARLHHLTVPPRPGQSGRPSNLAVRAFKEERCRTQGIPHLWAEASWVKLVFAVLIHVSERWGQ